MDHWEDTRIEDTRPLWLPDLLPWPEWHMGPGKVASLASCPLKPYEPVDDMIPLAEGEESADKIEVKVERIEMEAGEIKVKLEKIEVKFETQVEKIKDKYREFVTDALNNGSSRVFKIPGSDFATRVRLSRRRKLGADRIPVLALTVVVRMPNDTPPNEAESIMGKSYLKTWRYMRSKKYDDKIVLNFVRESDTDISENPDNESRWLCEWTSNPMSLTETCTEAVWRSVWRYFDPEHDKIRLV